MNSMQIYLNQLWDFRGFVLGSVKREFQAKYKNSALGVAWVVLPAIAQIAIYTLIFSQLIRARLPGVDDTIGYSVYLCAGIVSWGFFGETISRCVSVFLDNGNIIKKLLFPKICLPAVVIASAVSNFFIMLIVFLGFLAILGKLPGTTFLAVAPLLVVHIMMATGIGVALGVVNVFFRDIGQLTQVILQFWFWLTPIVYPMSILPERVRFLVELNPITPIVSGYQNVFVYHSWPEWSSLSYSLLISLVSMTVALGLYRRHAKEIVDEL